MSLSRPKLTQELNTELPSLSSLQCAAITRRIPLDRLAELILAIQQAKGDAYREAEDLWRGTPE